MTRPTADRRELEVALLDRLAEPVDIGARRRASVALDIDGAGWTFHADGDELMLAHGASADADSRITTDARTMVEILRGERSGVEAFIAGDLRVRGDLALTLRLSGWLPDPSAPVRFPRGREAAAGGGTFYLEAGEGDPVVLLHGLGATNASMLPTLWDLAADHRVIAPDLPGFGDSVKPVRSYDAGFYGRWLVALLDELGVERAHLVGNSLGGRVAIEAALQAPERVDRLALLTPSPAFIKRREFVRFVKVLRPELGLVPLPMSHRRVVASIKALFSRPHRLPDQWYAAAADEFLRVFSSPRGRVAFFSAARQIYLEEPYGETGFWDRLRELSRPALFVWGDRDRLVPAGFARHVERAVPDARSLLLADCGHVPQFELPERTHAAVREFFAA
ncbi:MAG TPA: alpha/beta fold hydrolase [Actinomycetota bacterium]|nr:alpha/beta fold hydrolase [Actinomycetota bacterium]